MCKEKNDPDQQEPQRNKIFSPIRNYRARKKKGNEIKSPAWLTPFTHESAVLFSHIKAQ